MEHAGGTRRLAAPPDAPSLAAVDESVYLRPPQFFFERGRLGPYSSGRWIWLTLLASAAGLALHALSGSTLSTGFFLPYVVGAGATPIVIRSCFDRLNRWATTAPAFLEREPREFETWLQAELTAFEIHGPLWLSGLLLAAAAFWLHRVPIGTVRLATDAPVALFAAAVAGFTSGVAAHCLFLFSRIIWRLGDRPLLVQAHAHGVRSIGQLLALVFLLSSVLWGLVSSTLFWHGLNSHLAYLAMWYPVLALTCFVGCQVPLHAQMVAYKRRRTAEIEAAIRSVERKGLANLSEGEREYIEFLEGKLVRVDQLPEWPFGWEALATVALSGVTTLLPLAPALFAGPR